MYFDVTIRKSPLEVLSLEVTTECNLDCTYCFALAGISQKKEIEWNSASNIIKEGFQTGFRRLHLTGGEPFLWKHIFRLLDFAFDLGYNEIIINTNAILLTEPTCRKLASYDRKIILTCSINGARSIHESIRGAGSYEKSCAGIEKALEHKLNVNIFTTIGKRALPDIPVFTDALFKRYPGINNLLFIQLRNVAAGSKNILDHMLSPKDFIKLVQFTSFLHLGGYPAGILENPLSNVVACSLNMNWLPKSPEITRYGKMMILCNGDITANHSSRDSYGTYRPGKLEKVLTSRRYLEDVGPDRETCPNCEFHHICSSGGMIHPSLRSHDHTEERKLFCKEALQHCYKNSESIKNMNFAK